MTNFLVALLLSINFHQLEDVDATILQSRNGFSVRAELSGNQEILNFNFMNLSDQLVCIEAQFFEEAAGIHVLSAFGDYIERYAFRHRGIGAVVSISPGEEIEIVINLEDYYIISDRDYIEVYAIFPFYQCNLSDPTHSDYSYITLYYGFQDEH